MADNKDERLVELKTNDGLPTLFIDNLVINTRSDKHYLVRFATELPEGLREQARVLVPEDHLKRMLDVLCKHVGHFPSKPKSKPKRASGK